MATATSVNNVPRLRLTAPVAPERDLHEAVALMLTMLVPQHVPWTCFPSGHIELTGQQAAKLVRMGLKRNWPDILILINGVIHGLELKRRGAQLSKDRWVPTRRGGKRWVEGQEAGFRRLAEAGMIIGTASSVDEAAMVLRGWGCPLRGSVM